MLWRSVMSSANWPRSSPRAGSRLSVARLNWNACRVKTSASRVQREQSQSQVAEREQQRFDQERALEIARGEYEGLQARAHAVGEEHSHLRAGLAGIEERLRAEKAAAKGCRRSRRSSAGSRLAAENSRVSWNAWASNGRGCLPTISSSINGPPGWRNTPHRLSRLWKISQPRKPQTEPRSRPSRNPCDPYAWNRKPRRSGVRLSSWSWFAGRPNCGIWTRPAART